MKSANVTVGQAMFILVTTLNRSFFVQIHISIQANASNFELN